MTLRNILTPNSISEEEKVMLATRTKCYEEQYHQAVNAGAAPIPDFIATLDPLISRLKSYSPLKRNLLYLFRVFNLHSPLLTEQDLRDDQELFYLSHVRELTSEFSILEDQDPRKADLVRFFMEFNYAYLFQVHSGNVGTQEDLDFLFSSGKLFDDGQVFDREQTPSLRLAYLAILAPQQVAAFLKKFKKTTKTQLTTTINNILGTLPEKDDSTSLEIHQRLTLLQQKIGKRFATIGAPKTKATGKDTLSQLREPRTEETPEQKSAPTGATFLIKATPLNGGTAASSGSLPGLVYREKQATEAKEYESLGDSDFESDDSDSDDDEENLSKKRYERLLADPSKLNDRLNQFVARWKTYGTLRRELCYLNLYLKAGNEEVTPDDFDLFLLKKAENPPEEARPYQAELAQAFNFIYAVGDNIIEKFESVAASTPETLELALVYLCRKTPESRTLYLNMLSESTLDALALLISGLQGEAQDADESTQAFFAEHLENIRQAIARTKKTNLEMKAAEMRIALSAQQATTADDTLSESEEEKTPRVSISALGPEFIKRLSDQARELRAQMRDSEQAQYMRGEIPSPKSSTGSSTNESLPGLLFDTAPVEAKAREEQLNQKSDSDQSFPSPPSLSYASGQEEEESRESAPLPPPSDAAPKPSPAAGTSHSKAETEYDTALNKLTTAIGTLPERSEQRIKFEAVKTKILELASPASPIHPQAAASLVRPGLIAAMRKTASVIRGEMQVEAYVNYAQDTAQGHPSLELRALGALMFLAGIALGVLSGLTFAGTFGGGTPLASILAGGSAVCFGASFRLFSSARASGVSKVMLEAAETIRRTPQQGR